MTSTSLFKFGLNTQTMWRAHQIMREKSTSLAMNELGEVAQAYTVALELVVTLVNKDINEFTEVTNSETESITYETIHAGYIAGLSLVERTILEGYTAQAAALVRQELEAITALEELRLGKRKEGKTPYITHLPGIPGTAYGDLSKLAHFSDTSALSLVTSHRGEVPDAPKSSNAWLLSPQHVPNTTRQLFALHTWLLLHLADHQAARYANKNGSQVTEQERASMALIVELLKSAGVVKSGC
jgi:hypothetical protein